MNLHKEYSELKAFAESQRGQDFVAGTVAGIVGTLLLVVPAIRFGVLKV